LGVISGELVKSRLPPPHDLEYEKTFWPYIILTKKRYVGNKYEFNKNKYKMDFMGIVLKRRDNAPIVKEVCEGIITRLLNDKDPIKAKQFTEKCLTDMVDGKYDIKYFLTSKTLKLKESYADWTRIAHVVLAERIGKRDPGNKPQSGDRIEYAAVCIDNETKETLQGDKIETPLYIKENKLDLDYLFYIRNQIMNPAIQFLELAVKNPVDIFNKMIVKLENKKSGQIDITSFLKKKSRTSNKSTKSTKSIIDSSDSEKPVRKTRKKKEPLVV
jgi:DNA polymerase elongation subunit (family B)